jgi:hypothetical protein
MVIQSHVFLNIELRKFKDEQSGTPRKRKRLSKSDTSLPSIEVQRVLGTLGDFNCFPHFLEKQR